MSAIELKPCPFCGGEAAVERYEYAFGRFMFFVGCADEDCMCSLQLAIDCDSGFDSKGSAVDAWNRRAVDTDALLALADRFECGSSDYMTRAEIAEAIREAVGVGA